MFALTRQCTCVVQGRTISYREVGDVSAAAILLLHGLTGSSAEYDKLIPVLADEFHLIAPDYIGFGASEAPEPGVFAYTFGNLTDHVAGLIEAIGPERYMLYMHDCGGPIGFRLFARAPPRVTGFIIQNANAYAEGLSTACFCALAPLWENRTSETERAAGGGERGPRASGSQVDLLRLGECVVDLDTEVAT